MYTKMLYRFCAVFLCLGTLFSLAVMPAEALEREKEAPLAVLWSGSDMQGDIATLETLVRTIQAAGHTHVDEALFLGDYANGFDAAESTAGTVTLRNILYNAWGLDYEDIFMVQGNHDVEGTENLDSTGVYEREHYIVYQINFLDMQHFERCDVLEQAQKLRSYLGELVEKQYRKPVFIINHMPLHHSVRGDARYTKYLVDVLNEAGSHGLNLFFLFGHNHSHTYDHYIGGNCIYYPPGSTLLVTDLNDETKYTAETITFTYMNGGYVGYTYLPGTQGSTSTVFEIYSDHVELTRYGTKGLRNLKDAGFPDDTWGQSMEIDSTVIPSPQKFKLKDLLVSWEDVSLEREKVKLPVGGSCPLFLDIWGSDSCITTWTSSNEAVLSVEGDIDPARGVIRGVADGSAVVTASVCDALGTGETVMIRVLVSVGDDPSSRSGVFPEEGGLRFYIEGEPQIGIGLISWRGDYYYVRSDGFLATGAYWITDHNGYFPAGEYLFGTDGKMIRDGRGDPGLLKLDIFHYVNYHWNETMRPVDLPGGSYIWLRFHGKTNCLR